MKHLASANDSSAADLATWRLYIQASTQAYWLIIFIIHMYSCMHVRHALQYAQLTPCCSVMTFCCRCSTDSPSTPDHETGGGAASSKRQQSAATSNIHQQDSRSQQARASVHSDKEASEKPTPSDTSGVVISATTASQPIKASDSKLTAVGDVLSSKDISGATANAAPEQASGSKQTGVRVSTTTPNCVFSPNKPDGLNQNTYLPSAESDLFRHDKEWLLQPKSEESKDHECESCDEHVPGRCNVVLSRKSPKQEKKQKRAEGGNYKQL